jgi:hypothetical protein
MEDPKHLQSTLANSIGNQIRPIGQNPFTSPGQATFSACRGKSSKVINAGENGLNEICRRLWVFHRDVRGFVIEIL